MTAIPPSPDRQPPDPRTPPDSRRYDYQLRWRPPPPPPIDTQPQRPPIWKRFVTAVLLILLIVIASVHLPELIGFIKSAFAINPKDMSDESYIRGLTTWAFLAVTLIALIRISRGT